MGVNPVSGGSFQRLVGDSSTVESEITDILNNIEGSMTDPSLAAKIKTDLSNIQSDPFIKSNPSLSSLVQHFVTDTTNAVDGNSWAQDEAVEEAIGSGNGLLAAVQTVANGGTIPASPSLEIQILLTEIQGPMNEIWMALQDQQFDNLLPALQNFVSLLNSLGSDTSNPALKTLCTNTCNFANQLIQTLQNNPDQPGWAILGLSRIIGTYTQIMRIFGQTLPDPWNKI